MGAKDLIVRPVARAEADALIKSTHYSGKVVNNSQLHIGVFWRGRLEGAMQFGPPLDKRKTGLLVRGSEWHNFMELNRLAFRPSLPRNSESRALAVTFRILRRQAPQLKWIVSFADATQCGDGTIYRASGFLLTGIKKNNQIWAAPTGETVSRTSMTDGRSKQQQQRAREIVSRTTTMTNGAHILADGAASMKSLQDAGWRPLVGHQFRYVRFLDDAWLERLTVPVIPFDRIPADARMYLGQTRRPAGDSGHQLEEDGASPISPLHSSHGR